MTERLYTDHPARYDAIQSAWDYDRDVAFVERACERHGVDGRRLLEIGCGTGEHTRRLHAGGADLTAVDRYRGMLGVAREKCDAAFVQTALPELGVRGEFDVAVAIRGVVNHLAPDRLRPALSAVHERLADGEPSVFVFDNAPLPPGGNDPALDVGETERGRYARVAHHAPRADGRLDWRSVTFTPDGDCFVSSRPMTPFADGTVRSALESVGFTVHTHEGYGRGDDRTVFVAVT